MEKSVYRIGQIVPSSNTTMETEVPSMLRGARNCSAWSLHLSFQPNAHAQSHQGGA